MSKINPFDLPSEEERSVRIVLRNIDWDLPVNKPDTPALPAVMSIPVDSSLPDEEMVAKAIDKASDAWGFCILDCDVDPIEYGSSQDSISDTLEYQGEIY